MIQRLLPFFTLIALFIGLAIASPRAFLSATNLSTVVRQTTVINIMALGMTMIIISGGIDLSVGAILAMGGVMGTMAMQHGYPIPAGIAMYCFPFARYVMGKPCADVGSRVCHSTIPVTAS